MIYMPLGWGTSRYYKKASFFSYLDYGIAKNMDLVGKSKLGTGAGRPHNHPCRK